MKIRKIKFTNHPLLGDLDLDFTDKEGNTINTIIIAGENGVGKSVLLNTIYEFSKLQNLNNRNEKRFIEIELSKNEVDKIGYTGLISSSQNKFILKISMIFNQTTIYQQSEDKFVSKDQGGFANQILILVMNIIFSDVEINFTPKQISTITSKNIDNANIRSQRSNSDLATEITQLLVDVQSIDALELNEWARKNIGSQIDEDKIDVRMKRFTSAFEYIFPLKKYKKIENFGGHKLVLFEENGKEMDISKLSSGEKQIVFRGSFLLKDKESSKGALILIDEPEISLHPVWQLKILSFFKKLFTNNDGEQASQIIVATHSPFIIHNANRSDDRVIVLQKDEDGKIVVLQEPKFLTWSTEKIVQDAFNITHVLSNKTTIFLEGETDEKYYNKCLEIFDKSDSDVEFKWIGRINDKGQAENTGDTALNQAKTFFTANMQQAKNKVILLYDSDTNKPEEDIENLLIRVMTKNESNTIFKKGVENLLTIIQEIDVHSFYKVENKTDSYSAESIIRKLDKTKLCSFICDTLDKEKQKIVLSNLNKEIEKLIEQK